MGPGLNRYNDCLGIPAHTKSALVEALVRISLTCLNPSLHIDNTADLHCHSGAYTIKISVVVASHCRNVSQQRTGGSCKVLHG